MSDDIVRVEPYWYIETDCLGSGSFGEVYKGHSDLDKKQLTAIKRIRKGKLPQHIIDQEIQILQELSAPDVQHSNFVTLLDCVQTDKHVYLVMEYCNGGDLDRYLKEKKKLDEPSLKIFLRQIASALQILHSHEIVHRDLKPANILLSNNGSRDISAITFKIADFGMGRFLDEGAAAQTFCGTPVYMAPEIFVQNAHYDYKADLWSIGMILYQCFTGTLHSAFQSQPIKFPATISPSLRDLLTKLLCKDPASRIAFDDFYYHPFIGMSREIDEKKKQAEAAKKQQAAAAKKQAEDAKKCATADSKPTSPSANAGSSESGVTWLRRVFSIRRKSVKDDKQKIVDDDAASTSNPASPSRPLSPMGKVHSPGAKRSPNRPNSPHANNDLSPKGKGVGGANGPSSPAKSNSPKPKSEGGGGETVSTQMLKSLVIDNRDVYGIAHFDVRFYALCRSPNILIQYSDQSPFIKIKDVDLSKYAKYPQDVAACEISKCVYVTDIGNSCIWKVEVGYPPKVTNWISDVSAPHTLSVNPRNGQITTFGNQSKHLNVYGSDKTLVHHISLPSDIKFPQHAVETSKGNFVVSYGEGKEKKHGVCEINSKGKIISKYDHKVEKLNHPTHLALDADDRVYVVDNGNNRVLLLDSRLKFERVLPSDVKDQLENPFRLCYATVKGQRRLLVEHRVNVIDIFNVS